jgi:hypothetical protein
MQAALDSTALMVSKEAATVTSSQLQTDAVTYFNEDYSTWRPSFLTIVPHNF